MTSALEGGVGTPKALTERNIGHDRMFKNPKFVRASYVSGHELIPQTYGRMGSSKFEY